MTGLNPESNQEQATEAGEFLTPSNRETVTAPLGYRLVRVLLRLWFGLALRKIRLLYSEGHVTTGPAIFFVHHPASLVDAMLMVATFEQRVHCLLQENQLVGIWRRLVARALEIVPFDVGGQGWDRVVDACCDVLLKRGILVAFEEPQATALPGKSRQIHRIANLAAEAELRHGEELKVSLSPVYLFVPVEHSQSRETLVFQGAPVSIARTSTQGRTGPMETVRAVASALEGSSKENAFRLNDVDLKVFLRDLEEVFRFDLAEDWGARKNWKQQAEGFVLSQKVVEWVEVVNALHPGHLVALREALETYRENQRRKALAAMEIERMPGLNSRARRLVVWLESILGFPVALYGLLNHALIWMALASTGLLKRDRSGDKAFAWAGRILVALAFYSSQILLCDHLLGRAAAGYYAPSLPMTGIYLWRYHWLLRHRTRLAFLKWRASAQAETNRQMRARLIKQISDGASAYAGVPGAQA